jgi:hypothetical protein
LTTPKEFNGEPVNDYSLSKKVKRNSCLNSSSAILVADNIASWYNSAKGYAVVSVNTLIDGTGLSRRTVFRALEAIEASGEWKVEKTDGQRNKYFPNLDVLFDDKNRSRKITVKTNRGAAGREALRLKREKEKTPPPIIPTPVVSPDSYTFVSDEDTDPVLDGKPLYAPVSPDGFQPPVCVPKRLETALGCAERLFRRVPVSTRNRKSDWTVSHLLSKYEALIEKDYPLAAIDILMWLQAEEKQALNTSFLATVLSMCTKKDGIIEPVAFNDSDLETNPALNNAMMVYRIHKARESSGNSTGKKYVEAL